MVIIIPDWSNNQWMLNLTGKIVMRSGLSICASIYLLRMGNGVKCKWLIWVKDILAFWGNILATFLSLICQNKKKKEGRREGRKLAAIVLLHWIFPHDHRLKNKWKKRTTLKWCWIGWRESMNPLYWISFPLLIRSLTSNKLLNLAVPQFPLLPNCDFTLVPTGKVAMKTEFVFVKCLANIRHMCYSHFYHMYYA